MQDKKRWYGNVKRDNERNVLLANFEANSPHNFFLSHFLQIFIHTQLLDKLWFYTPSIHLHKIFTVFVDVCSVSPKCFPSSFCVCRKTCVKALFLWGLKPWQRRTFRKRDGVTMRNCELLNFFNPEISLQLLFFSAFSLLSLNYHGSKWEFNLWLLIPILTEMKLIS